MERVLAMGSGKDAPTSRTPVILSKTNVGRWRYGTLLTARELAAVGDGWGNSWGNIGVMARQMPRLDGIFL
jgi:hypothetical protein